MSSPKLRAPSLDAVPKSGIVDVSEGGGSRSPFSKPEQSRTIPALCGRKVLIVTDDRDLKIENVVTNYVLEEAGTSGQSKPIGYSELFQEPQSADVLILRSSRLFSISPDKLVASLERFREANPRSAVIVCTFEYSVMQRLQPLVDAGVINRIENRPPGEDQALLRSGAELLQKLESL